MKEQKRQEWQRMGRFALNRWGRENALALNQPGWLENARRVFAGVGLNFDEFSDEDLSRLLNENPEKFKEFVEGLKRIPRKAPPEEK